MKPSLLLRLEGLVVFIAVLFFYARTNNSWWLFVLLVLVPDLSAMGYLKDAKLGSFFYNTIHTYILPAILFAVSFFTDYDLGIAIALIWFAHIGVDRCLGFGLKYPTEFKDTHLNRV